MALDGFAKVIKYLLFLFNLIFFLSGATLFGLGITLNVQNAGYATLLPSVPFMNVANLCIAVGAIVIFVAFLGCCGAVQEHTHLLLVFFISLLLIFILEIVAGSLGFVYRQKIDQYIRKDLKAGLHNYNHEPGLQKAWDSLQKELDCCGIDGPGDWKNATGFDEGPFPDSCCKVVATDCAISGDEARQQGCLEGLRRLLEDNVYYVGAISIAVGIFEILGMAFAMYLYVQLNKERKA
ncbi:tetraspanin-9-like [Amphiura filiformis]|uniref:tetraspanin-9-like n=1 Tax=Amphiura filiformis TaxID=82378 RepID=UPI003B20CA10